MPVQSSGDQRFPAVGFLVRFGGSLAWALAIIVFLGGLIAPFFGASWSVAVGGALISPLVLLFVQSYVEMVRVISDTLLPR